MDLYEHMGKDLFRAHGIETPRGIVAFSAADAASARKGMPWTASSARGRRRIWSIR